MFPSKNIHPLFIAFLNIIRVTRKEFVLVRKWYLSSWEKRICFLIHFKHFFTMIWHQIFCLKQCSHSFQILSCWNKNKLRKITKVIKKNYSFSFLICSWERKTIVKNIGRCWLNFCLYFWTMPKKTLCICSNNHGLLPFNAVLSLSSPVKIWPVKPLLAEKSLNFPSPRNTIQNVVARDGNVE